MFGFDDTLVESMRVNVTTVYGYLFDEPKITVSIPLDADAKGLFDIKF